MGLFFGQKTVNTAVIMFSRFQTLPASGAKSADSGPKIKRAKAALRPRSFDLLIGPGLVISDYIFTTTVYLSEGNRSPGLFLSWKYRF